MRHTNLKITALLMALSCLFGSNALRGANPVANPDAVVTCGNARFTVLTPEMVRIEYSDSARFEDRATFAIQNRRPGDVPRFTTADDGTWLTIATDSLTLRYRKGSHPMTTPPSADNLTITMTLGGEPVEWYPGKPDPLNLKGTCRTLDGSNGDNKRAEMENGVISRSGWAVIDDSWSNARPDGSRSFALAADPLTGIDWWAPRADTAALDLYFMGYGHDYRRAIKDFTRIAGDIPLPPDYVFGYWYSKYASYSADDYRCIMADLEANDIPADVMILDMDWHWNGDPASESAGIGGWTGWSWNTNLIPNPVGLLRDIHDRGLHVALNLHPADGVDSLESPGYFRTMKAELDGRYTDGRNIAWSLDYPDFTKSFFSNIIRDHEREGVDFWWLDWQQHLTSRMTDGLGQTFWCNHVFFNDMAKNRPERRPVIFHRWGGLGSHRYQIGFSGDAHINYPTLAFQPYFTATASNVGYTFWGHDLGGHALSDHEPNDPELVLRWIQFGVFTPIFRTHATKDDRIERQIWRLPDFPMMRDAVKLRYALFPYIYTMARKSHDTGIGLCRPMYYDHPEADEAYTREGQYMFGDDILVAPVTAAAPDGKTSPVTVWFPAGEWWDVSHNRMIHGPATETIGFALDEIPYFYRAGSIIPLNIAGVNHVTDRPERLRLDVVAGADGSATLYDDAGDNSDYATSYATTAMTHTSADRTETIIIDAPVTHGSYTAPNANRAWTVSLLDSARPAGATFNGKPLDPSAMSYDATRRCLTLVLPAAPVAVPVTLTVTY